jgi:hypothetical protein
MERDTALLWDSFVMSAFAIDILVSLYLISLHEWLMDLVVFVSDVVLIPLLFIPVLIREEGVSGKSRATPSTFKKILYGQLIIHALFFLAYLVLFAWFSAELHLSERSLRSLALSLLANVLLTAAVYGWWGITKNTIRRTEIRGNGR